MGKYKKIIICAAATAFTGIVIAVTVVFNYEIATAEYPVNDKAVSVTSSPVQFMTENTDPEYTEQDNNDYVFIDESTEEYEEGLDYLPEYPHEINENLIQRRTSQLHFRYLMQLPQLPTGCEITSLTAVLNYYGYNVSKVEMAEKYLEKCSIEEGNFVDYFLGDPMDEDSFGCYSGPIVKAANEYLNSVKSDMKAYNKSGTSFEEILNEVGNGYPVAVWSTIDLKKAFNTMGWYIDDKYTDWIAPEHCVVITGYDLDKGTVNFADPLRGTVKAKIDLVELRYRQMGMQAVVIK